MKKLYLYLLFSATSYGMLAHINSETQFLPGKKNKEFRTVMTARLWAGSINTLRNITVGGSLSVGNQLSVGNLVPFEAVATDGNGNLVSLVYTSSAIPDTLAYRDDHGNLQVGMPINVDDAVNKAYVDSLVLDLDILPAVLALANSNVTLTGTQTIDGVALVAGNRVLLINQTNGIENGIWLVEAGAWVRPADFADGEAASLDFTFVQEGAVYANSGWVCTTEPPADIIGTDPLTFQQFSGAGSFALANVGTGPGQVFKNQTGSTFNLRTINNGTHITVTNNTNDITLATDATSADTPNTLVARDGSGNFSAGTITASLTGNATSATTASSASNFSGSLVGDVTGTQGATVVSTVGGQSAANVAAATALANSATNLDTAGAIVKRDGSGNFSAGNITANLTGNATSATTASSASNFSGSLVGDVTGTQGATVVSTVGGQSAANVAAATVLANSATNLNTASTIVKRDASGNFSAGIITASLSGNATSATTASSASNFSGSLVGDVTGTQGATVVSTVGGQSAANVAAGSALANSATNLNTASTIVKRDASGNFSAGTITATFNGNLTGGVTAPSGSAAAPSITFSGDTNTGLSAATADTLVLSTNGTNRLQVGSTGTVTIAGNVQYNGLNTVGTTSLGGVAMTAANFPKIITINSSLSVANLALVGSVNIDLTPFGFTAAPICVVTPTTSIGALGFANFYTSGITSTNVTVNALVGVAAVGLQNINFSLIVVGY